ncbi:MAG: transposase [Thermoplasmata archaeon]|nr:transposase [Candidatus Sysuiplasma acidicola]MBX8646857.1 transposase [Candidatus Sysuiplasma acidicola]
MHSTNEISNRRIKDFVLKRFERHFQLPVGNSDYTKGAYIAVLVWTAMVHKFVDGVAGVMREKWLLAVPSGDTVRRALNRMPAGDVKRQMLEINGNVISAANRMRMFTMPVTCAIDCNDREYYGKRVSKLVVGGKHKNGTSWFYRIATFCVVEKGMRFEIAATEYNVFSSLPKVVRRLIDDASRHVRIRHLLMDRAFSTVEIRHMLTDMGISYVMPIETNDRIEREVKATRGLRFRHIEWVTTYRGITDTTTLIIIDSGEVVQKRKRHQETVYWLYVTNMSVTDENIVDICRYYDDRCGIETGYRVDDHEFTGMTTSHSDAIRLFYLFLSVILRNIWTLLKTMQSVRGERETAAYAFKEEFRKDIIFSSMRS